MRRIARYRGGEERRLPFRRRVAEDPLDVLQESHAQHLVRLVEHHHRDAGEIERAAAQVIHHPARRADDHVNAGGQAMELELHRLPAVDGQHAHGAEMLRVGVDRFGDLDRELTRRRQHERLDLAPIDVEARQERQRERGGLARPRLRLSHHVPAREERRDRLRLDRRRRLVPDVAQRRKEGICEAECGESVRSVRHVHVRPELTFGRAKRVPERSNPRSPSGLSLEAAPGTSSG